LASIGTSRALAQVSCTLERPSETRPNEGKIIFKIELPPIASPSYDLTRQSAFAIELNRLLERAIVKSRCVDVEELCVRSGERCWTLRVEATALNNEGNMCDTMCLAAMGALMHYRRPEVTVDGTEVTVHEASEKEPVKLTLHHKPFTVTMGYTHAHAGDENGAKLLILDPTRREEKVAAGSISVAINKHREICAMHLAGESELNSQQILSATKIAAEKVVQIQDTVEKAVKSDDRARKKGNIPRIPCSAFLTDFGDLSSVSQILEEIESVSRPIESNATAVKVEKVERLAEPEKSENPVEKAVENPVGKTVEKSNPIVCENGSNWNETEKWWNENKKGAEGDAIDMVAAEGDKEDTSDEEDTLDIVQSEFS